MSKVADFIIANLGWIITVIAFFIPPVRDFIIKKFQLSLDKALEDKKSLNDRKNYISKTRFDAEFEIYRSLSRDFFKTLKTINTLIPYGLTNELVFRTKEERNNYYISICEEAVDAYITSQDNLNGNAAFMPECIYNKYKELLKLCKIQIDVFKQRWNKSYKLLDEKERMPDIEDHKRTKEIFDKFEKLNKEVRNYLADLDVL